MKNYITHWVIGIGCVLVWFWGDKVGVPPAAIILAASIVPGLIGHALGSYKSEPATSPAQSVPGVQP